MTDNPIPTSRPCTRCRASKLLFEYHPHRGQLLTRTCRTCRDSCSAYEKSRKRTASEAQLSPQPPRQIVWAPPTLAPSMLQPIVSSRSCRIVPAPTTSKASYAANPKPMVTGSSRYRPIAPAPATSKPSYAANPKPMVTRSSRYRPIAPAPATSKPSYAANPKAMVTASSRYRPIAPAPTTSNRSSATGSQETSVLHPGPSPALPSSQHHHLASPPAASNRYHGTGPQAASMLSPNASPDLPPPSQHHRSAASPTTSDRSCATEPQATSRLPPIASTDLPPSSQHHRLVFLITVSDPFRSSGHRPIAPAPTTSNRPISPPTPLRERSAANLNVRPSTTRCSRCHNKRSLGAFLNARKNKELKTCDSCRAPRPDAPVHTAGNPAVDVNAPPPAQRRRLSGRVENEAPVRASTIDLADNPVKLEEAQTQETSVLPPKASPDLPSSQRYHLASSPTTSDGSHGIGPQAASMLSPNASPDLPSSSQHHRSAASPTTSDRNCATEPQATSTLPPIASPDLSPSSQHHRLASSTTASDPIQSSGYRPIAPSPTILTVASPLLSRSDSFSRGP